MSGESTRAQRQGSTSEAEIAHQIQSTRWETPRTFFSDFRPGPWHTSATYYYARDSRKVQATASNCQEHSAIFSVLHAAIEGDERHDVAALQNAVAIKFAMTGPA